MQDAALIKVVNLDASTRLLQAAISAGVVRWVQLSSLGAYGSVNSGEVTVELSDKSSGSYEVWLALISCL